MIGAGVLGVCVAARLAEAGVGVTLLEQDRPGHAATRSSFAWLNANDKAPRAYHDLNHAGMRAWAALSAALGGPPIVITMRPLRACPIDLQPAARPPEGAPRRCRRRR